MAGEGGIVEEAKMEEVKLEDGAEASVGPEGNQLPSPPQNANKKRKVALFVAYIGTGYSGMQHNEGVKTIESVLEAAIARAGGISKDNAGDFLKVNWMRAARTDKGVSAVGQVVSLKMVIGQPDIVERINTELPPEIRVLGYKRVIGSFDARHSCDRRRYEYVIPAFAFDGSSCPTRAQRASLTSAAELSHPVSELSHPVPESSRPVPELSRPVPAEVSGVATAAEDSRAGANPSTSVAGGPPFPAPAAAETHPAAEAPVPAAEELVPSVILEATAAPSATAPSAAASSAATAEEQLGNPGLATAPTGTAADESSPAPGARDAEGGTAEQGACLGDANASSSPFVFGEAERLKLNRVLADYQGTHNFHNLATRVAATDNNAKRFIISAECQGTFLLQGQTWVKIVILGQSFMLNQIRKMVGLAVAVMRGLAPHNAIPLALDARRNVDVPIAPAVGLFLDESIFDSYNTRWGTERGEMLTLADFQPQIAEFKEKQLYPSIGAQDAAEQCTSQFIRGLSERSFLGWEALPLTALVKKNRSREPGSAAIVAGMESYGLPGAKPRRGEKRKMCGKWNARKKPYDVDGSKPYDVDGSKPRPEFVPLSLAAADALKHEWSD